MPIYRLFNKISGLSLKKLSSIIYGYEKSLTIKKRYAFYVFLLVFLVAIFFWQAFIHTERNNLENYTRTNLNLVRYKLDSFFDNRLNRLDMLADAISHRGFESVNLSSYGTLGLDFIAYVDNSFVIQKLNSSNQEQLLKKNLNLDEADKLRLLEFRENTKKNVSSKFHISGQGKEVSFLVPVLDPNNSEFIGLVLGSIKIQNLMDYVLSEYSNKFHIKLIDSNTALYENSNKKLNTSEKIFFWNLDPDSIIETKLLPLSTLESLEILASPSLENLGSFRPFPDYYIIFFGFLFSVMFAFVFYFITSTKTISSMLWTLLENLDKQFLENNTLKDNLINISRSAEKNMKDKEEVLQFHKSSAYRVMQEAIKSQKEQEQIGNVIRRNSHRLELALESAGIGIWTWNILEDKIVWDEFTHKIFGVNPDRTIASYSKFLERVTGPDLERVDTEIRRTLKNGGNLKSNFNIMCPDGYVKNISLKAKVFLDINSNPVYMTGIVQDMSYEINNSTILNKFFSLPIIMFCVADLKGNFKMLNSTWSDVLGFSIAELKSQPFLSFVHPDDRNMTQTEYQMLLGEGGYQTINFENHYLTKSGEYKQLMWNAIKVRGDNFVYAIAWDMSTTKQESYYLSIEENHRAAF